MKRGETQHLVVDAMNVIGSRPNGWWRDRDGAVRTLVQRLARLGVAESVAVTMVIDGRPLREIAEGEHNGIEVLYARRSGRNSADDRIVEYVAECANPGSLEVVTSDRDLTARARTLGARVSGPQQLLEALDRADSAPR
jgi:predicted RNA-binding protein with PIN domain